MKAIRILALLLAVLMLVSVVAACGGGDETTTTTPAPVDPTPPPSGKTLAQALVEAGFGVVGAERVSSSVNTATATVINKLKEVDRWISVSDDFFPAEDGAKEIIIGNTKRASSATLAQTLADNRVNSSRDWQIKITQDTVLVVGASDAGLCDALAIFSTMLGQDSAQYYPSYDSGLTQYNWPLTQLGNQPIQNYKIVLPAGANAAYQTMATNLQSALFTASGYTLPIIDDTQSAGTTELILGATTRPVSATAQTALQSARPNYAKDGIVYATATQIALIAGSEDSLDSTLAKFATDYLSDSVQAQVANINKSYQAEGLKQVKFGTTDAGQYQIVVAKDATFDLRTVAYNMQVLFYNEFGYNLKIVTDDTGAVQGQKEILLGQTARPASTVLADTAYNAKIDANGNVVFDAGNYVGVQRLYNAFLAELEGQSAQTLVVQTNYNGTVTDIPITWQADPNRTTTMPGPSSSTRTLSNSTILSGFNFNEHYELVWNDEFDGTALNYEKWTCSTPMVMPDMNQSSEEPYVVVKDGVLTLTATYDATNTARPFTTSYGITTYDTMNYGGGYLEMRAQVPFSEGGLGEWPSFWSTSGSNYLFMEAYRDAHDGELIDHGYYVEVDFFEQYSKNDGGWGLYCIMPNMHKWFDYQTYKAGEDAETYIRNQTKANHLQYQKGELRYKFNDRAHGNEWHVYGFLWTENLMAVSVDGQFYWAYDITKTGHTWSDRLYNEKTQQWEDIGMGGFQRDEAALNILINNMFFTPGYAASDSGAWAEWTSIKPGTENQLFPCSYVLDYMRLYQSAEDHLYTPKTIGSGTRFVETSRWDYAINGNPAA